MTRVPLSGRNLPPFWMKFLKEEGALLNVPPSSTFILAMSDWLETSRDIVRICQQLEVVRRGAAKRASPTRGVLLAPLAEVLINLEDTVPLNDLDSGKIIPNAGVGSKPRDRLIADAPEYCAQPTTVQWRKRFRTSLGRVPSSRQTSRGQATAETRLTSVIHRSILVDTRGL